MTFSVSTTAKPTEMIGTSGKPLVPFFVFGGRMTKLLKVEEVAECLGCSDDQIRQLINCGELSVVDIGRGNRRRCIRIPDEELLSFLQRRTIERPQAKRRKPAPKPQREWV